MSEPRKHTTLIAMSAAGAVALVAVAVIVTATVAGGHGTPSSASGPTSSPAGWCGPNGCFTATPAAEPPASPSPTVSDSCAESAEWAQDGDAALIDAYINNQSSGNINADEIKAGCPQFLPIWQRAQGGIGNGESHAVPGEVKPGTYETTSADLDNCYWERARNGQTLANNFVIASKAKIRVTIRPGDDTFISRGCGNWVRV